MNTARIFKEELTNPAIWDTIVRELELPEDADEITVKAVCYDSESKRKSSKKPVEKLKCENSVKAIQIVISGGAVQSITKPLGITLEIRDYDVEGADVDNSDIYKKDENGDWYQRMFWNNDETEG